MTQPSIDDIRAYWNRKAEELKTDPTATMKDGLLRELEIETISRELEPNDVLVDVGAGNAFASIRYAEKCQAVHALDFAEQMVREAENAIRASGLANVHARQSDVFELSKDLPEGATVINCTRVLINLGSGDAIAKALEQLIESVPEGGKLILTEGIDTRFDLLNRWRTSVDLEAIELNWHNTLLDCAWLESKLEASFKEVKKRDYGLYYFVSRVVHPLLVRPKEPTFGAEINQVAAMLLQAAPPELRAALADLSILSTYICRN